MLLDFLGLLDEPDAAHHVISVFHAEDFSDLFRNGDAASSDDFCEEWNVFFIHLDGQVGFIILDRVPPNIIL